MENNEYREYAPSAAETAENGAETRDEAAFSAAALGVPPQKTGRVFSPGETAAAWIALIAGYALMRVFPASGHPLGAAAVAASMYILTAVFVLTRGKKLSARDILFPVAAVILSAGYITTSVPILRTLISLWCAVSYVYWAYCALAGSDESFPGELAFFDFIKAAFIMPFSSFGCIWKALFAKKSGRRGGRTFAWILLGLAVAVVPTAAIIALLSYDEAFTEILRKVTDWPFGNLFSHFLSVLFGVPAAMYIFGLLISSADGKHGNILRADTCRRTIRGVRFAPAPLGAAALTPALLVYAVFFVSQIDNYCMAFSGQKPDGLIYSEYAREGFFELCAVAAINAVLLLIAGVFMKRNSEKAPLLRIYASLYSVFTLVLIATAVSKMVLYIGEFGLTRLRVLTCCFMLLLAVCFAAVLLKQFVRKLNLVGVIVCASALCLAAVSLTDVDELIAEYNVNAYLSGNLEEVDVDLFYDLGDGAVPSAVKLADSENAESEIRSRAEAYLDDMAEHYASDDAGIFSWSIPRAKAEAALERTGRLERDGGK